MRHHTLCTVVAVAAIGAACSIDVRGDDTVIREEKRFTVSGQPELQLRTFDGSIRLKSWDRNEILVEIERRGPDAETARRLTVDTSQQGNRVVVEVPEPREGRDRIHFGSWQSPSVSLVVTAPRRMTLDARTGDGSIAADDLAGSIVLNTGDGSIRVRRVEGGLRARTGDGSISISDVNGQLEAESGDGSIDVGGRLEAVNVRSGDGSVRVDADQGSVVKSDWNITTGDGSISVHLPGNIDAELDAHSNDGRVRADDFNGLTRSDRDDDSGSVRGRLGRGGRSLRVRSGDGSITISRR
jgi:Putative adhesin